MALTGHEAAGHQAPVAEATVRQASRTQGAPLRRPRLRADYTPIRLSGDAGPEERVASADLAARTARALAELPEDAREVVVLRDVQGLSTKEAAEVLGVSEGAVKVRLHRAHARLRELVGS